MPNIGTESQFEETTIDRLKALGYRYEYGGHVDRPNKQAVVLVEVLRDYLRRRYRHLPTEAIQQAIDSSTNPAGVNTGRRNMAFQERFRDGFILNYEEVGEPKSSHIYLADFERPELNDFLVVNQLRIDGPGTGNSRVPDLIVYLNGLPLVVFELKNPWNPEATIDDAYNQLQHYTHLIPQLFDFNGFCVISDERHTHHGVHSAGFEWFAAWKSIDGREVEPPTTSTMKTLLEGLFRKERLLNYLRHFIVHEVASERLIKKGARYHQFFATNFAVEQALRAMQPGQDKRAGIIWHTQGSGKSLEMVFLIGILRRWPGLNPMIVVQVDRNDLDNQLYDSLVAAKALLGEVTQAASVDDLRAKLRTQGGEVVCTTIEKFNLKAGESEHPQLSDRHNLLVVADEAHRTQYGLESKLVRRADETIKVSQGFALNLRQALPNAAYIGFTGTPIDKEDANTVQIFGDYIHIYDMQQAKEDKAVVPIYYEARHIPLRLTNEQLDQAVDALAEEYEVDAYQLELAKAKWSAIEQAAGTKERVETLARDLLDHFNARQDVLGGKAMIVCMSRRNCVKLYNALVQQPDCPEVKVVMTGNLTSDPAEWSQAGHITTKAGREAIKARFIDPADPLKLVIVCDMWLTGFDAPVVNTLYVDRLMKEHSLIQAIARVNRIFGDKEGGLIVDYIGIGDRLQEATRKYTHGGGRGKLTADLEEEAVDLFLHQLQVTRANMPDLNQTSFPAGAYARWRGLSNIELSDLNAYVYGILIGDEEHRDDFLEEEYKLSKAYGLIKHLPAGQANTDEVAFYQLVRKQLNKIDPATTRRTRTLEGAIRDLLDDSIAAQPKVDIFTVAGLDKPDVSILDEQFLSDARDAQQENLQVRLLAKLLDDDLRRRNRHNPVRYRSYKAMLDEALSKYNNRTFQVKDLVEAMREIRAQQGAEEQRQAALGLSDEEMAFYDVIALDEAIELHQTDEWIAGLAREVAAAVRANLEVDWTKSHRSNVYAAVQSAVGRVLRRHRLKGEPFRVLRACLMKQAEVSYARWPEVG
jgi:type I restriction enzyme R subunit